MYICLLSHVCYLFHTLHSPHSEHPHNWLRVQITKLLTVQVFFFPSLSPTLSYSLSSCPEHLSFHVPSVFVIAVRCTPRIAQLHKISAKIVFLYGLTECFSWPHLHHHPALSWDIAVMNTHMFCMKLEDSIIISHLSNFWTTKYHMYI